MKAENLNAAIAWFWYWILGPWAIGVGFMFASGLTRLIMLTELIDNELHLHVLGIYIVTSRAMSFSFCIVVFLITLGLMILLSRRVIAS
jgi:hypothetical protein